MCRYNHLTALSEILLDSMAGQGGRCTHFRYTGQLTNTPTSDRDSNQRARFGRRARTLFPSCFPREETVNKFNLYAYTLFNTRSKTIFFPYTGRTATTVKIIFSSRVIFCKIVKSGHSYYIGDRALP